MDFYAYIHRRPDGTPFYVGKGCDASRKRSHSFKANRNQHYKNIISKYGAENIIVEIILCESEKSAFEKEVFLIAHLRLEGYALANQTEGGEGVSGLKHSIETKKKMSVLKIGCQNARGHKCTAEAKAKMASSKIGGTPWNKGMEMSAVARAKMSDAHKGHKHSEEHKAKISASGKGLKRSLETCKRISVSQKGRTYLNITIERMRKSALRRHKRERDKQGGVNVA